MARSVLNDDLGRSCKVAVVAYFKIQPYFPGGNKGSQNNDNRSWAYLQIRDLPANTKNYTPILIQQPP